MSEWLELLSHSLARFLSEFHSPALLLHVFTLNMTTAEEQKKLVETLCRKFISVPWQPISQMQRESSRDAPARGSVWISRMNFPAPTDIGLRDALYRVCERLREPGQSFASPTEVPLKDVGVEFIGSRFGVEDGAIEPKISEQDKLQCLERECKSDMTILYIHGGAM